MQIAVYSTAATAASQRAAEWGRVIADTYFPLQLTYRDPDSFSGELERRQMGQVSLSRLATGPLQYERHARDITHNNPEEYLLTVPRRGPVDFSQMGREVSCAPGGFILERGDEPYRFPIPSRTSCMCSRFRARCCWNGCATRTGSAHGRSTRAAGWRRCWSA